MKKLVAALLVLILILGALSALGEEAAPAFTIAKANFHVIQSSSNVYAYLYLKIVNETDKRLRLDSGHLDILDPDGNVLVSSTSMTRSADTLNPGESSFVCFTQRVEAAETPEAVGDYQVALSCREVTNLETLWLPSESVFEPNVQEGSWDRHYMTTQVTNNTARTVFGISIGRMLLDAEGNMLYYDYDSMYSYKGLTPGSSIVLHNQVSSTFKAYFEEKGYVPTTVEAIAYASVQDASVYAFPEDQEPGAAPSETGEQAPEATAYATLQKGSKGDEVRALQQRLKDLGYLTGSVDGDFGKGTAGAVSAFQSKAGLADTSVADDATQKALFADDAPHA